MFVCSGFRSPFLNSSIARLGTHALIGVSELYRRISRISSHPDYKSGEVENDIALVKLDEKVTYSSWVSPVALAAEEDFFNPKSECWVIGWGNVHEGSMFNTGSTSNTWLFVHVYVYVLCSFLTYLSLFFSLFLLFVSFVCKYRYKAVKSCNSCKYL